MKEEKKWCVYAHINKINNKKYIGMTSLKPIYRWNNGNGYSPTTLFKKALDEYGWDNFEHEILEEELSKEEAEAKEIEFIKLYKTTNIDFGYNMSTGGLGSCGVHPSKEKIEKLRKNNNIKVVQLTMDGAFVKVWNGCREAERSGNFHSGRISDCCKKKRNEHFGYKWMFLDEHKKMTDEEVINFCKKENRINLKKIVQLDLNDNFIKTWEGAIYVKEELGLLSSSISECCSGKRKKSGGFKWMYYDDYVKLVDNFLDKDTHDVL